jgi:hypothetical protein
MISSISNETPETKKKVKLWFLEAKKAKSIATLYILDNLLKNTQCICQEKGIIEFIKHCTVDSTFEIDNTLIKENIRIKNNNINIFNSKYFNCFFEKVK